MSTDALKREIASIRTRLDGARTRGELLDRDIVLLVVYYSVSDLGSDEEALVQFEVYRAICDAHGVQRLVGEVRRLQASYWYHLARVLRLAFTSPDPRQNERHFNTWVEGGLDRAEIRDAICEAANVSEIESALAARLVAALVERKESGKNLAALAQRAQESGYPRNRVTIRLARSKDRSERAIAAELGDVHDPYVRAALASALANEAGSELGLKLANVLRDYPQELGEALRTSPNGHDLVGRMGSNCPELTVASLEGYRRELIEAARRRNRHSVPWHHLERWLTNWDHFGGDSHHSRWELRELIETLAEFGWRAEVQPIWVRPDAAVNLQVVKAIERASALAMAGPVWLERVDLPRWQYLNTILPGHPLVRQHLEQEVSMDEKRDKLAQQRNELVTELRNLPPSSGKPDGDGEPLSPEQTRLVFQHLPEVSLSAVRQAPQRVRTFLYQADEYARQVTWSEPSVRTEVMKEMAHALPPEPPFDTEGVLGMYHPVDHRVVLYPWMIELWAERNGWDAQALEKVALLHETAHAALIRGRSAAGGGWDAFDNVSVGMHEALACICAERGALDLGCEVYGLAKTATEFAFPDRRLLMLAEEMPEYAIAAARSGALDATKEEKLREVADVLQSAGLTEVDIGQLAAAGASGDAMWRTLVLSAQLQFAAFGPALGTRGALRLDLKRTRRALQAARMGSGAPMVNSGLVPALATRENFIQAIQEAVRPDATERRKQRIASRSR